MASLWPLAVLPLLAHAFNGFPADNQMAERPGIVRYPITVVDGAPPRDRVFRRQNEVILSPQKSGFFYSIEVKLGTPSQPVSVNFDTGSDELWVNPSCTKSTDAPFCHKFGRFNGSQTFVDVKRTSTINYGTGFANLEYGYDYVQIGSSKLSQQLLGVATDSEFAVTGILGAGPNLDGWNSHYPTVIDNLATQGFTNSRAFSLDLRNLGSKRGSVIFGGIDTKKYSGALEKLPIVPANKSPDSQTRYWVYLDGLSISTPNGSVVNALDKPKTQVVLLDSGYTVCALPSAIFDKIVSAFPEAKPPAAGSNLYEIPCSAGKSKGRLDFKFGKTVINVSYDDFIWHQSTGTCVLGVTRDDDFPVLGDTFLRAAYVVYDWDNRNLHVANNEDCGSQLVAIGKGPDSVPSIVGECGAKSTSTSSRRLPRPTHTSNSTFTKGVGITSTLSGRPAGITARPSTGSSAGSYRPSGMPTYSSDWASESTDPSVNPADPDNSSASSSYSNPPTSSGLGEYPNGPSDLPNPFYPQIPNDSDLPQSVSSPDEHDKSASSSGDSDVLTYTSTFTSTSTYAVKSCDSSLTKCPVGSVTTETITGTTTWCPSQSGNGALSTTSITSTIVTTKTLTMTRCNGPNCDIKHTLDAPTPPPQSYSDITATWTIPRTHTCTKGERGCAPGQKITSTHIVTVKPMTMGPSPTPVPGCDDCRMPPPVRVTSAQVHYPSHNPLPPPPPAGSAPAQVPPNPAVNTVPGTVRPTDSPCISCGPVGPSSPMVTAGAAAWRAPLAAAAVAALCAVAV